jgi:hypothetical protein
MRTITLWILGRPIITISTTTDSSDDEQDDGPEVVSDVNLIHLDGDDDAG